MAVYKDKKCPKCAGTLLFNDNGYTVTCDSCGKTFTLSELNNSGQSEKVEYKKIRTKSKEELESYETILDTGKAWSLSPDELVNRIQIAIKTKQFSAADSFCCELQRRDPENVDVYLYKLLVDLKVSKKEHLGKLKESFEDNKNYKLIMDLGDSYIKKEMQNYLAQIEINQQNDDLEAKYKEACKMIPDEKDEEFDEENGTYYDEEDDDWYDKSYTKAAKAFKALGDYKNSVEKYQFCMSKIQEEKDRQAEKDREYKRQEEIREQKRREEEKKDKIKSILKFAIPALIVIIIITIIATSIINKNKQDTKNHDISNISINITYKNSEYDENASPWINGRYYVYFNYKITNNTEAAIDYIALTVSVKNKQNVVVGTMTTSFGCPRVYIDQTDCLNLQPNTNTTRQAKIETSSPDNFFNFLYNTNLSDMSFEFSISSVSFADGYHI